MSSTKPSSTLGANAVLLAATGFVEFGLQFMLPIVLVRNLVADDFGMYRFLMLTATTAVGLAPALMPQSLYYFLPRATCAQQGKVIGNVLGYLIVAGCIIAIITSPLNPFIGDSLRKLFLQTRGISSIFFCLWIVASIAMVLPIAEGRISWFVSAEISIAFLRTLFISLAALWSHRLIWIAWSLGLEMIIRLCVLSAYFMTTDREVKIRLDLRLMFAQLRYSSPFALGAGLFMMRAQSDQWIAATTLSHAMFATFTIGAVVLPVAALVRQPINNAVLPHVSHAFAANDFSRIRCLISRSNAIASLILLPISVALFIVAPELVKLIYTDRYITAIPVMRIYLVGIMLQVIATGYVLPSLNMGAFSVKTNSCCLVLSVAGSILGIRYFGVRGAALGSVLAFGVSETLNLLAICRRLKTSATEILPLTSIFRIGGGLAAAAVFMNFFFQSTINNAFVLIVLKTGTFFSVFLICYVIAGGWSELKSSQFRLQ